MTEQELKSVRMLHNKICDLEKHLRSLRLSAENITPIIDGLPHAKTAKSRVEKIAVLIVEHECELKELQEQFITVKSKLADKIMSEVTEPAVQTLLMLRYVECCTVKEIACRMQYSIRAVFKMHAHFLKVCIRRHIVAQNQS